MLERKEISMSIFRQVDGKSSHTPVSPSPGVRIYERHHRIYLKTDFGLTVRFDGDDEAGDFLCACVSVNGLADNAVHRNNVPAGGGSFCQRSPYHACTEGRLAACAATTMDKVKMTG